MAIQLKWSQNFEARGVLEHLQCSDMTLMFGCFIVPMESTNWVIYIISKLSIRKPIKVKHTQLKELLSTSIYW